jgi:hypothetical protein
MHPEFCGVLEKSGRRGVAATLLQHLLAAGNSGSRIGRGGCEMPGATGRSRNATGAPPHQYPSTNRPVAGLLVIGRRKNKHMTKHVRFLEAGQGVWKSQTCFDGYTNPVVVNFGAKNHEAAHPLSAGRRPERAKQRRHGTSASLSCPKRRVFGLLYHGAC